MWGIKLKSQITGRKKITYVKKDGLYANVCDNCGKIFQMDKYCNDNLSPGHLKGTFDEIIGSQGNMFSATVCSYKCADAIFLGGWKTMKGYKEYARQKAILIRGELGITSLIKEKEELISDWEDLPEKV